MLQVRRNGIHSGRAEKVAGMGALQRHHNHANDSALPRRAFQSRTTESSYKAYNAMASYTIENWHRFALCANRGMNPDLFMKADTNHVLRNRLRRICFMCPVQRFCLDSNLLVSHGMFGGLIRRERMALAIKRGIPYELLPSVEKDHQSKKRSDAKRG